MEDRLHEFSKRGALTLCLKDDNVLADRTASGRLFQSLGPSLAKNPSK